MRTRSTFHVMTRLIGLIKPLMPYMILAILMGTLGFLSAIFITVFGGYAILSVVGQHSFTLTFIFGCLLLFAVARGTLRYGEQLCNHYIAFKLLALIRDKVLNQLRRLAPAKLDGRDKGDLIALITSDIELLEVFYAHTISPICIAFIMTLLMTGFIGMYSPLLGFIAFSGYLVVGILIPYIASKYAKTLGEQQRLAFGTLNAFFLDSLRGLRETIQYTEGAARLSDICDQTDEMTTIDLKLRKNIGINASITGAIILIFSFTLFIVSSLLYLNGSVGLDGVIIPTIAMFSSFGPVVAIANLGSSLSKTIACGNRVLDLLDEEPLLHEITEGKHVPFTGAKAQQLTFSYEDEVILKNLNINLRKNTITGIVGKSGSGKSTFLKLLMRFWAIDSGSLNISDVAIDQIPTQHLRDLESFVTQDTHLFHDTIEANIRIAKLDATKNDIIKACQKASVHEFIMSLPHGYATSVAELGETLSGGERQRIGLARAFLHDAPLMLLDEPTSNLDSLNEAAILKSLKEDTNRTIVLVSHRESTMHIADSVYSVENGRVS